MAELARWLDDMPNHPWIVFIFWAWPLAYLGWHTARELKRPRLRPEDIVYQDNMQSARRMTNLWTRMGSANNCMKITLLRDRMVIRPNYPFSAIGRVYGLDVEIPYESVLNACIKSSFFARKRIVVRFRSESGEDAIEFTVRDYVKVLALIQSREGKVETTNA